jgi:signal transduction histidine kinase
MRSLRSIEASETLGGRITVESELHHGSTFTVHLPAECVVDEERAADPEA